MLYSLFELAAAKNSRLILIGVANALDLADRFLPRLAARGASPRTLKFAPYGNAELASIILQRVEPSPGGAQQSSGGVPEPLIESHAVQFCAKKVAASSGDARRALEVCRAAADFALEELRQYELDRAGAAQPPSWASKPPLRFEHMSKALSTAFKSSTVSRLASLPQHQQVCAAQSQLTTRPAAPCERAHCC